MRRLRLIDLRLSRLPEVIGKCQGDIPGIASYVNDAQRRLITCKEVGNEGWYATFAEIAFTASQSSPYITMPRHIARVQSMAVCQKPISVNNQLFEYLQFGNGRLPQTSNGDIKITAAYTRNNVPTFIDLTSPPQLIRIYSTDAADMDGTHRVLIQGLDTSNTPIYSQDGLVRVQGQYVTLASPFSTCPIPLNSITGIQKDITNGTVQFFQVDPATGNEVLIHVMEPGETTASYRRYYLDSLPSNCCSVNSGGVQTLTMTAIVKLDLVPVVVDTDYTLLQNSEAIIEECASIRYGMVDTPAAKQMAHERHIQAVRYLVGEIGHYLGIDTPAVSFLPFGSASLDRLNLNLR
jgi:hypothetical protein